MSHGMHRFKHECHIGPAAPPLWPIRGPTSSAVNPVVGWVLIAVGAGFIVAGILVRRNPDRTAWFGFVRFRPAHSVDRRTVIATFFGLGTFLIGLGILERDTGWVGIGALIALIGAQLYRFPRVTHPK